MNLEQWKREAVTSAATIDHEWDHRVLDWQGITAESVVLEIGAYKGRWALQMAQKFNPSLYCFEPQPWAYEVTCGVLDGYNAKVFNYGLGAKDEMLAMHEWETDACSFVRDTRQTGNGRIRDMVAVMDELGIEEIDICLINIEGYEYELVPYMLTNGILPKHLAIQFHGTPEQENSLRELIEINYRIEWDYGFVLACWTLK